MASGTRAHSLVIAVVLGAIWPFAVAELLAFSGHMTVPLIRTAYDLGLGTSARLLVRVIDAVLWATILGGLFGIPLGLIARGKVIICWLAFLAALLVVNFIEAVHTQVGVGMVLLAWSIPETWLYVIAVLAFAHCTTLFRSRQGAQRAIAP